jgi:hypothetical protein
MTVSLYMIHVPARVGFIVGMPPREDLIACRVPS